MKKLLQLLFHRVVIIGVLILLQLMVLLVMILKFNEYFVYFYAVCIVISIGAVLYILNSKSNPAYKIAWIIPILIVPLFGGLLYLVFGGNHLSSREVKKMEKLGESYKVVLDTQTDALQKLEAEDRIAAVQSRYITDYAWSPIYQNTSTEYLKTGEEKFERILEELKKAEHYIFLEYFIIEEGKMWNTILDVLVEKVKQGVDVRVIYDDMGCIMLLPGDYPATLRKLGIKCHVFNPFIPVLSSRFNNRDHRKICVIDGHTGFTGGINLADEYINAVEKHGHWKDTAVMLKGEAVWNLTVMFLSMWDYIANETEDYEQYRPTVYQKEPVESDGYVQPYCDSPLDGETVGETVYMNLISKAENYVYINTPYLIISNEMVTALCTAAKCGVDVRIVTPHLGDKWFVHSVTRAYYEVLVEAGVKIYEYTPGFVHAKTFLVDDKYGVVGTINLDYRSLYLHFECGNWMYKTKCLQDMKEDYLTTLKVCQPITLEACQKVAWYRKIGRGILRVFAPLM